MLKKSHSFCFYVIFCVLVLFFFLLGETRTGLIFPVIDGGEIPDFFVQEENADTEGIAHGRLFVTPEDPAISPRQNEYFEAENDRDSVIEVPSLQVNPPIDTYSDSPHEPFRKAVKTTQKTPSVKPDPIQQTTATTEPTREDPTPVITTPNPQVSPPVETITLTGKEKLMLDYLNEARENAGLGALVVDGRLVHVARAKSRDNSLAGKLSHVTPTYGNLAGLLKSFGIDYRMAGENIGMNSSGNVYEIHHTLITSPVHREIMLNPYYTHVGSGIYVDGAGNHFYTQLFIAY